MFSRNFRCRKSPRSGVAPLIHEGATRRELCDECRPFGRAASAKSIGCRPKSYRGLSLLLSLPPHCLFLQTPLAILSAHVRTTVKGDS